MPASAPARTSPAQNAGRSSQKVAAKIAAISASIAVASRRVGAARSPVSAAAGGESVRSGPVISGYMGMTARSAAGKPRRPGQVTRNHPQ